MALPAPEDEPRRHPPPGHVARWKPSRAAGALAIVAATGLGLTGLSTADARVTDTAQPAQSAPLTDRASPGRPSTPAPTGWTLVWNDEFTGNALNRASWNVENDSTFGDGNQELACLLDRPENVSVADGLLTITARDEPSPIVCGGRDARFPDGRRYTSGMLTTKNKVDFEYGRFEIRARTPLAQGTSKGLWPAFWLRPSASKVGEVDILEAIGTGASDPFRANRVVQTIHYDYEPTFLQEGTDYDMLAGTTAGGFHDYALEWAPGSLIWFVDGVRTFERNTATTPWLDTAFVGRFFMRLNLAVGGSWPGSPDADTSFPASFQVDFVRVYQR
ncbi:glycoside hydrolase family 16 protein [Microterricola pindariensis]|uniref:GH16 domain-containing protein n=1 Tax=Microterricola pindariensis TaxID=478010 RepID=A0ABX5AZW7_9MICO|nr:glycoside hydrolase family 16 protein [Microterricola pindariensis]PPL19879.1 hypothetical protein GY24_03765 [Microterricola pindariensis]